MARDHLQVTRKVIRKCVSVDGAEKEEASVGGAPQGTTSPTEGDGYSKVVKRTVLKSEGDHTEVGCIRKKYQEGLRRTAE